MAGGSNIVLYFVISGTATLLLTQKWWARHKVSRLPGPTGLPIVGALREFSHTWVWTHFAKYKDTYGPIATFTIFGQPMIIINDKDVAIELLDKRSAIYSNRPALTFTKMSGMENFLTVLDYGEEHKAQRTVIRKGFGSNNSMYQLQSTIEDEMKHFIIRRTSSEVPDVSLERDIRNLTGAILLKTIYGYSMARDRPDPLFVKIEQMLHLFLLSIEPGKWLVNILPSLRHMPEWMPGSGFKQVAKSWTMQISDFVESPYAAVKEQMNEGIAQPCFISSLLQNQDEINPMTDFVNKWSAATVSEAGSDTTVGLIHSFILAMVLYPEVQEKAQIEIDRVLGKDRLPSLIDRNSLPYLDALVKEVFRWHTVVPLGIPHVASKDDIYNDCLIPKGAIIFPNIWFFNHDPSIYHDPYTFKPERFLTSPGFVPEADPGNTVFGFGRRMCVGKKFAETIIFKATSMLLATVSIGKAIDAEGNEITPTYQMTNAMSCHPKEFACKMVVRSARAAELLNNAGQE